MAAHGSGGRRTPAARVVVALAAAFVASFLSLGVPYWRLPYLSVSLPSSLYGPGLAVVVVAAAACRWVATVNFRLALLAAGAAAPCVVLARVAHETAADPTSHNLWPFEVAIAAAVGFSAAAAGALASGLIRRLLHDESGGEVDD